MSTAEVIDGVFRDLGERLVSSGANDTEKLRALSLLVVAFACDPLKGETWDMRDAREELVDVATKFMDAALGVAAGGMAMRRNTGEVSNE